MQLALVNAILIEFNFNTERWKVSQDSLELQRALVRFLHTNALYSLRTLSSGAGHYVAVHPSEHAEPIRAWLKERGLEELLDA